MNKFKINFIDVFDNEEGIKGRKRQLRTLREKKFKKIKNKFIINI